MKIALVIFPLHDSHGCILQTFALKEMLAGLPSSVDIIDIQWQISSSNKWKRTIKNTINKIRGKYHGQVYYDGVVSPSKMSNLKLFIDEYLGKELISVYSDKKLRKIDWSLYDAVVVGSDQTWRPQYVPNIYHYFLDFLPNDFKGKRISYAASFGTDNWEFSSEQEMKCKELVSYFDAVSVRESSGLNLCDKYLDVKAINVLDPTFLYPGSFYIDRLHLKKDEKDYIATYWLDITPEKQEISNFLSQYLHTDVLGVNQIEEGCLKDNIKPIVSIQMWLQSSLSARFVVVDSFHAMVFAILFHKQFIVVGNIERGLSRFESLLDILGLRNRLVLSKREIIPELINKPIDWVSVDEKLQKVRKGCKSYLEHSLKA